MRSGKSAWAERIASSWTERVASSWTSEVSGEPGVSGEVTYIATAPPRPSDTEWKLRVRAHRDRRPTNWHTAEIGENYPALAASIQAAPDDSIVLVDDLGTWLTGVLDQHGGWDRPDGANSADPACDELIDAVASCSARLLLVSPEVGWGVVPATRAGRVFADAQGRLNQRLASVCEQTFLVVAGLALPLSPPSPGQPSLNPHLAGSGSIGSPFAGSGSTEQPFAGPPLAGSPTARGRR
jgi:adenosylcobinamide kinase/adenosylcobinamide-phosphate guanylyltransferase